MDHHLDFKKSFKGIYRCDVLPPITNFSYASLMASAYRNFNATIADSCRTHVFKYVGTVEEMHIYLENKRTYEWLSRVMIQRHGPRETVDEKRARLTSIGIRADRTDMFHAFASSDKELNSRLLKEVMDAADLFKKEHDEK